MEISMVAPLPAEANAPVCPDHRAAFINQMRLVPGAVAIVATATNGQRTGLAATAWNSLTADPPTLLACINRNASAHDMIESAGAFSVNLMPTQALETVAIFSAQRGLDGAARFLPGEWVDGPLGQPIFQHSIASFECTLEHMHDHGSHSILIGKVGEMQRPSVAAALLYLDGQFASAVQLTTE